jgi:hypothetical protein
MSSLKSALNDLVSTFADSLLAAIRESSLEDLLSESGKVKGGPRRERVVRAEQLPLDLQAGKAPTRSGRLARRSPEEIAQIVNKIVLLVKTHKEGMRAEEIRSKLGLLPKEMPRVLKDGLAAKKLASKGQKRATTYFAK